MQEEIKKVLLSWNDKGAVYGNILYIYDTLLVVDEALQKCEEILGEAGLGIGYTSKKSDVDRLLEGKRTLSYYIDALCSYVESILDEPLRKDFKKNATETISRIHLKDFETDNTVGLTEHTYISGSMYSPGTDLEQEKGKLTFADFIGTSDGQAEGNGLYMSYTNGCVEGFADIFAGQYEAMKASGMLGEDTEMTQQEFLEQFYKQGEFTHDSSNPFLNFVSSVLDITIIKPIIEACTGEDFITGEDLTDLERGLKVVFAVVDLATLGGALAATKLSELGGKESLKFLGKTVLIDFASNTAACGVGALGEAFDWPVPITIMLSLAAGITVSISGNKMLFKNADGIVIGEKVLDDDEIKIVNESLEGGNGSKVNKLTSADVKAAIEKNGMSVDEFSKLLDPNRILTPAELKFVDKVRADVGLPQAGTVMNKTIPQSDIYNYLYNESYSGVRGFVSVDEHSSALKTLDDVFEGNRLDYNNTAFKIGSGVDGISQSVGNADTVYGKITYVLEDADSVKVPTDFPIAENAPYTGRGFTGSKNIVLPEVVQENRNFVTGDILGIYDSISGNRVSQFIYDKKLGEWILYE